MTLDGSISRWPALVFVAALLAAIIYSARRYGVVPKSKYLRDPRTIPYAAFWNFLSEKKWTAEGVEFHRQYLASTAKIAVGLFVLWLILDAIS